jgi:hypothetical protein
MTTRELTLKKIDRNDYKKRGALLTDVNEFITEDTLITKDGNPVLLYLKLTEDTSGLRWAVKNQKYQAHRRSNGLKQESNLFGYTPRITFRQDYCSITAMAEKYPKQHSVISSFIENIHTYYQKYFPETYALHNDIVEEKVIRDWKMGETPFTSGIVNKNNALKYHTDTGNFKGVLSNMVVLKKGVQGGHLVVPELDMAFECADNTLVIFNGQDLVHGVSPIEYDDDNSYRYSVVYYSLESMWKCEPLGQELKRIQKVKTKREQNRIDPEHLAKLQKDANKQTQEAKQELEDFISKNKNV